MQKKKYISKIDIITGAIFCLFIAWLFMSFIEIMANNLKPDPVYSGWNFFILLVEWIKAAKSYLM